MRSMYFMILFESQSDSPMNRIFPSRFNLRIAATASGRYSSFGPKSQ